MSTDKSSTFKSPNDFIKWLLFYITSRLRNLFIGTRIKFQYGKKKINYKIDELILFCIFINGQSYLNNFIQYHFNLGIKHIIFIDNGSTDNSIEIIRNFENVTIFNTNLNFSIFQSHIKNYLFNRFAKKRWGIYLDVDELFDYPHSDKITIRHLLAYLNKYKYSSMISQMLDLFPKKPIGSDLKDDAAQYRHTHRFYDTSKIKKTLYKKHTIGNYNNITNTKIMFFEGGIRLKIFSVSVFLTKHPLILNKGFVIPFVNAHKSIFVNNADITGVIYHYKFINQFRSYAEFAMGPGKFGNLIPEYRAYLKRLKENEKINFYTEESVELKEVNQLIDDEFVIVSDAYLQWIKQE